MWRVVVVDDDVQFRSLTRELLDGDDHFEVCAEATNGLEAEAVVAASQPDAVVIDLNMPVMGGLEALPALREACPAAAVVIVSGSAESSEIEAARGGGAAGTLPKDTRFSQRLIPYLESLLPT